MADATALSERVEIATANDAPHVVIGFRTDGAASIYFGDEAAYHFNARSELRRAYLGGRLLKAQRGRLVALTRSRTEQRVELLSHELGDTETIQIIHDLMARISTLRSDLDSGCATAIAQVPDTIPVLDRARKLLNDLLGAPLQIARLPNARK